MEVDDSIPSSPVGWWQVDVQPNSSADKVINLGCWQGHIVDIARMLSGQCGAKDFLRFRQVKNYPCTINTERRGSVLMAVDGLIGQSAKVIENFLKQSSSIVDYKCRSKCSIGVNLVYSELNSIVNKNECDKFIG